MLASTTALAGVPEFIEATSGRSALRRVFRSVDVPEAVIGRRGLFITHRAFCGILEQGARAAGDANFGLNLAPTLHIRTWGPFGRYVSAGHSATAALRRLMLALPYHGAHDRMEMLAVGDEIRFHYDIPSSGMVGYPHYAVAAVRYVGSIIAPFVPAGWTPMRIEFDFPKPSKSDGYEDLFQCPVIFDAPRWAIVIGRETEFARQPVCVPESDITLSDLRRLANPAAPTDFAGQVRQLIRVQLLDGEVGAERAARQLGVGLRTLQRRLSGDNMAFRDLVLRIRFERAVELLRETDTPITGIATALGYSSPANFTRAFRQAQGLTPSEVRHNGLIPG